MSGKPVAVIGGGPMGLTAAYCLAKAGFAVHVFEADAVLGGQSAHFDFSGVDIERFYHFVCGPDTCTFALMKELGIFDKLHWTDTKMGYFYQGSLYEWGGPFELLKFPRASLVEKARYGLHVFAASKMRHWRKLDGTTALRWIAKWEGAQGYAKFWDSLFQLKFYERKGLIAAPWLWSRLARVAKSRKNIFQERMGWIAGGSFAVIDKLAAEIRAAGGQISLSAPVERIDIVDGRVAGIAVAGRSLPFETVVSTIPVQYLPRLAPGLPAADAAKLRALDNVGVVCAVAKLAQALSGNFWVNITDPRMDVPGVIEISNLRQDLGAHIVYVPFYLHKDNPKYAEPDAAFATKVRQYLRWINPALRPEDILDVAVFRYEYAQPVATPGFLGKLPPMGSPERRGFYFADTAYCYPEDRSIQESIRIARQLASLVVGGG